MGETIDDREQLAEETVDDRCVRLLREQGLRPTRPRIAVYRVLAESDDHPTAAEVEKRVREELADVSTATVYNCLDALQSAGLVGVMNEVHRAARYDAVIGQHHHLVCRSCGQVTDLHDPELDGLAPADDRGFEISDHSVHFYGLCPDCASER
jgi:Fe2+ or Zn2+ uptake regulation protein